MLHESTTQASQGILAPEKYSHTFPLNVPLNVKSVKLVVTTEQQSQRQEN